MDELAKNGGGGESNECCMLTSAFWATRVLLDAGV